MKHFIVVLSLLLFYPNSIYAQVKRQFQDSKNKEQTIVVKDDDANDFQILNEQFKEAKVGQVIRITTEKPLPLKQKKEKAEPPKPVTKKTPPPYTKKKKKIAPQPLPPNTWTPTPSIRYGDFKWKRSKKPRRKKYLVRKKYKSCFYF